MDDLGPLIMAVGPPEVSVKPPPLLEDLGLHPCPRKQTCSIQHLCLAGAIMGSLKDCSIKGRLHCHISNCFFHMLLQVTSKIALKGKKPFPKVEVADDEEQERE